MSGLRLAILAGFFLSGVTGLVYQNLWIRMLTLVVGGTTAALTTILIAFMGGLALGSYLFGAWADRAENPLRAYAAVEAVIGLYALAVPAAYGAIPAVYQALHGVDPSHGPLFHSLRFLLAVGFFGIPSTLMGGTLPLIVRALSGRLGSLQVTVATVYAVNTFGATLGAFITGFIVIPTLGLDRTMYATAGANFALAALFWFALGPRLRALGDGEAGADLAAPGAAAGAASPGDEPAGTGGEGTAPAPTSAGSPPLGRRGLLGVFFLMGASSLSYEILWSRLLGLSFGSSVYAISTMLTSFLLGIALGSWWYRRRGDRLPTLATLGWLEVAIAGTGLVTVLVLIELPWVVQYLYLLPWVFSQVWGAGASDAGFWALQLGLFLLATAAMILPTSLMGASFPIAIHLYADRQVGRSVGRVYASNTFGSILGSFITGFFLVEAVGVRAGVLGWSGINLLLGVALLALAAWRGGGARWGMRSAAAVGAVALCAGLVLLRWDVDTLTSGVYYHIMGMDRDHDRGDVFFTAEDDMALVSLHRRSTWDEPEPIQVMRINGKFMADDGGRVTMLALFAHTPLYLRGEGARRGMVIGLGGGYTAEAALEHPLESVDVLEISHAVVEAARVMNPALFEDPRLRVVEEDARAFLLTGDEPYDVIVSETSDPWITGVSNLYTEECFRWISQRLASGGVFGTWLQTRHKTVEDVRIILRTMHAVFPHMAAFQFGEGDTVLIMSNDPLKLDVPALLARYAQMPGAMAGIGIFDPWHLAGGLVLGEASLDAYLGEGPINTDDLPIIEFTTPRSLNIGLKGREVWDDLIAHAPPEPDLPAAGIDPQGEAAWRAYRQLLMGHDAEALAAAEARAALGATGDPLLRGRLLMRLGRFEEALAESRRASPSPRQALLEAGALTFLGRYAELEEQLRGGEGWRPPADPDRWEAKILQRRAVLMQGLGIEE